METKRVRLSLKNVKRINLSDKHCDKCGELLDIYEFDIRKTFVVKNKICRHVPNMLELKYYCIYCGREIDVEAAK